MRRVEARRWHQSEGAGSEVVLRLFGRWLRLGAVYGQPPGSHIGFWITRWAELSGVNLRIGKRHVGPCVTLFAHTRPLGQDRS